MATGRTVQKYSRIYAGTYGSAKWVSTLCGLTRSFGPLVWAFDEIDGTTICDAVHGVLPGQPTISPGPINVVLDPSTTESSNLLVMYPGVSYAGTPMFTIGDPIMLQIAIGIRAAPILGDPAFCGIFPFAGMTYADDGGLVTMTFNLGTSGEGSAIMPFPKPWGQLLHPYGTETAVNTATGADSESGASTTNGGIMFLQVLASGGSTVFKVQHADTNLDGSFADLTGASITAASVGSYYATVAAGTTVKRYLRWQGTAVTNDFVMSFIRG